MYTLAIILLSFSVFFAPTLAAPTSCFAGVCFPPLRYNQPGYDTWARQQVDEYNKAQEERRRKKEAKDKNKKPKHLRDVTTSVADPQMGQSLEEGVAGVYICEDAAWAGDCKHTYSPLGSDPLDCTQIDGRASSIGPDPGFHCIFYTNALCAAILSDGSDSLSLSYPGSENLGFTDKGDFNDRILSYQCFREAGEMNPLIEPKVVVNEGIDVKEEEVKSM